MKNLLAATIAAGAMATMALGLAATPTDATATVNALKASGYNVIVNKLGSAPMSACVVSAIHPGQEVTRTDSGFPGDTLRTAVVSKTMQVDLKC